MLLNKEQRLSIKDCLSDLKKKGLGRKLRLSMHQLLIQYHEDCLRNIAKELEIMYNTLGGQIKDSNGD